MWTYKSHIIMAQDESMATIQVDLPKAESTVRINALQEIFVQPLDKHFVYLVGGFDSPIHTVTRPTSFRFAPHAIRYGPIAFIIYSGAKIEFYDLRKFWDSLTRCTPASPHGCPNLPDIVAIVKIWSSDMA
jgi:hypothetical protein